MTIMAKYKYAINLIQADLFNILNRSVFADVLESEGHIHEARKHRRYISMIGRIVTPTLKQHRREFSCVIDNELWLIALDGTIKKIHRPRYGIRRGTRVL